MATLTRTIGFSKNHLVRTDGFDDATKWPATGTGTITGSQTDPLGGSTAELLSDTDGAVTYLKYQGSTENTALLKASLVTGKLYTFSVYMKPNTTAQSTIYLEHQGDTGQIARAVVTWGTTPTVAVTTGGSYAGFSSADIRLSTQGYYRVSITMRWMGLAAHTSFRTGIQVASATAGTQASAWVWGAQLEQGNFATAYNGITGTTDPNLSDYRTVEAWIAFINANTADTHIGQLRNQTFYVAANALSFTRTGTSATVFSRLEPASTAYDPVTNTGPKIIVRWASSGTNFGVKITESFTRITGIGLFADYIGRASTTSQTANGSEAQPVADTMVWIDQADDCVISNVFVSIELGTTDLTNANFLYFTGFYIGSSVGAGNKALRNSFYNCIVKGKGARGLRGLNTGWYFGSFADLGGAYNCIAYGGTTAIGAGFQVASHSWTVGNINSPEVVNCAAIDFNAPFSGAWRRAQYCLSSDRTTYPLQWNQLASSTGTNSDSVSNRINVSGTAVWLSPNEQDFRLRPGSIAQDAGLNLNSIFTAAGGPGTSNDLAGVSRSATLQNWDIGVYEGVDVAPTPGVTIVTKTIGSSPSRDFGSIGAFFASIPPSLYYSQERYVGVYYDDGAVDTVGDTIEFNYYDSITDAAHYVRVAANVNYNPRTGRGPRIAYNAGISPTAAARAVLWITSHHFELVGIRVNQTTNTDPGKNARGIEFFTVDGLVDACFILFDGTYNRSIGSCIDVDGDRNLITNSIFHGRNTTGQGPNIGLALEINSRSNQILHNVAYRIKGGTNAQVAGTQGSGFLIRNGAVNALVSGCAALETDTGGTGGAADFRVGPLLTKEQIIDHCFASDTSPGSGLGNKSSLTAADIFKNAAAGDFRLHPTSQALQAGANLSASFSTDITGATRRAPYDVGVYEGVVFMPYQAMPAPRDHHRFVTLWEITRNDGVVHLFSSSNEPIDHAGQRFKPVGRTSDAARRLEAALKDHNTDVRGAIVSGEITAEALAAGLYSNARIVERIVDWKYPWTTPFRVATFYIDTLEFDQDVWTASLVGPTIKLDQNIGETLAVTCEYEVGDADCQLDIAPLTQTNIAVSSVSSTEPRRIFSATSMAGTGVSTNDYFGRGRLTWLTGSNAGLRHEVKEYTGSTKTFKLVDKAPYDVLPNDRFTVTPGCRLRYLLDCIAKFNNGINFGGRPWLEGPKILFDTPTR